jgi:ABC-type thiamine transport system ATPase subunit
MPRIDLVKESRIIRSPRVLQIEGMFDMQASECCRQEWHMDIELPQDWQIGVIVGPSGAGKSSIARHLFPRVITPSSFSWPSDRSILDAFEPAECSIREIAMMLSSVGLSSPPTWLKPYHVLSTGEQFRVMLARALSLTEPIIVVDEFTSVVDRVVAQIGSAAVANTVRARRKQFVAVTCHYDVVDWLDPDWVLEPHLGRVTTRCLQGRPRVSIDVHRVERTAWRLFAPHHYLSHDLHPMSVCFVGLIERRPAVFGAVIHYPHPHVSHFKREHRLVCLPDYQGIGIGGAFSRMLGSLYRGLGYRYLSITTHPALIAARTRSAAWVLRVAPTLKAPAFLGPGKSGPATRLRATFEYVGPAMDRALAERLATSQPLKDLR